MINKDTILAVDEFAAIAKYIEFDCQDALMMLATAAKKIAKPQPDINEEFSEVVPPDPRFPDGFSL